MMDENGIENKTHTQKKLERRRRDKLRTNVEKKMKSQGAKRTFLPY